MDIDFSQFLKNQTLEETIEVLDELLCLLVVHTECAGLTEDLTHQYLTIRNLRNTFMEQRRKRIE